MAGYYYCCIHTTTTTTTFRIYQLCSLYLQGFEYLVKWQEFHISDATWEPEGHLQQAVINSYIPSQLSQERIRHFSESFERLIGYRLRSKNPLSSMNCDLDIFRHMTGTSETTVLCHLQDFNRFELPDHWYYNLSKDGTGRKIKFPIKLSARVYMRKVYLKCDGRLELKNVPLERVTVFCCTEGCSVYGI